MIHEIKKFLAALEVIMTEVDLGLWQWQTDLDLLSLVGCDIPLVIDHGGDTIGIGEARLVHNGSALEMSGENLRKINGMEYTVYRASVSARVAQPLFEEPRDPLPLVQYKDGKREEIGFAEFTVLPNGDIVARGEVTKFIPELHEPVPKLQFGYERGIEWNIDRNASMHIIEGQIYKHRADLDNHPFFKEENTDGS